MAVSFNVMHTRGLEGNDLQICVAASAPETIASVAVVLDGEELGEVALPESTETYTLCYTGVGSAGPQYEHTLEVTAIDQDGTPHRSVTAWTDVN